jgi:hypothetical protein
MPPSPSRSIAALGVLLFVAAGALRAADTADVFTLDLPFPAGAATPTWLGAPQVPDTTFATLNLPIDPPDATSSLLVTIFFQEKTGGFLRLTWQGGNGAELLSDNLYEGIGMNNQRSLLISPGTLQGAGTLMLQCGDTTLDIQRIRLQWLEEQDGLVSPDIRDTLVTPSLGATEPAGTLNGQPQLAADPAWQGELVIVPVTDVPQRIEQGVEFSVQLDSVPAAGRLALQENGLPWGKHLVVWINRQRAGTITPAVPELTDDGFLSQAGLPQTYFGWRKGSLYLPVSLLKAGVNTLQFSDEDEMPAAPADPAAAANSSALPLAVKEVVLQLDYPSTGATAAAVPTPAPTTTPPAATPSPVSSPDSLTPQTAPALLPVPTPVPTPASTNAP